MITYRLQVREYELDQFGHVNNAVYLQYAEAAKWDFFRKIGALDVIGSGECFPVVMENNVRYIRELHGGDFVRIDTVWETTGKILHFRHVLFNETQGNTASRVSGKIMFTDRDRIMHDIPDCILDYIKEHENEERKK